MGSNITAKTFSAGIVNENAALTVQKTTLTLADAEGTPDPNIQAVTNSSPYGFVNAAELITLLHAFVNLQTRMTEAEAALVKIGGVLEN